MPGIRFPRWGWLLAWLAIALPLPVQGAPQDAALEQPPMAVLGYEVHLDPDLAQRSLRGSTSIRLRMDGQPVRAVRFDAGDLAIDAVRLNGRSAGFVREGRQVSVDLPVQAGQDSTFTLDLYYHGAPRHGLEFHPERRELYTIFSASQWMVCLDSPAVRAPLRLHLALPEGLVAVASGTPVGQMRLTDGRILHSWDEPRAMPSFSYGFAAGPYRVVRQRVAKAELQYLSIERSEAQLRQVFAETPQMLAFFSRRAGFGYEGVYAQVLVASTIGQEAGRLALLSEAYGQRVLSQASADPAQVGLIAHELAHQWWGIALTNASWNHFWLNEGLAVFMAAAYLEHRHGPAVYARIVDGWRERVRAVAARGRDHPLVYPQWVSPSADDRTVVYQRGALTLHELRLHMGEAAFWRALRHYTRTYRDRSVDTAGFQRAMEAGSGLDLEAFFARSVYGVPPPP